MWSLELLHELVLTGQFPPDQALAIAEELHRISPRYFRPETMVLIDAIVDHGEVSPGLLMAS